MTLTKRCLSLVLALCMVVCLFPAQARAAETGTSVTAQEVPGMSRLETSGETGGETADQYAPDELVTVIVRMEEPAVMDYYAASTFAADTALSAGESVSAFLTSDDAKTMAGELLDTQLSTLTQLSAVQPATMAVDKTEAGFEVLAQWTSLINGMAVRLPYCQLETLRTLPGVYSAEIQKVYTAPEQPETNAGTAGYSYDMVNLSSVWGAGFTGEGMLIAVLDTGLDLEYSTYWDSEAGENVTGVRRVHEAFTDDSFMNDSAKTNLRWTNSSLAWFLENNQLMSTTGIDGTQITYAGNALYKNLKVPYAADYADGDVNVRPSASDHGTHVAGTIAGFVESAEGEVLFSGVAPDAQILAMKVFDDEATGAQEYSIINALEDAAVLGADVVNLSLGSDNGFAEDDTAAGEVYDRLTEAGILFMVSAGNAYYSSMYNNYGDYDLASNPEISMIAAPAVYDGNLSVASVNSTVASASYLQWSDAEGNSYDAAYDDPADVALRYMFADESDLPVQIIPVDGYGTYQDYYNAGFRSYYGYSDKGVTGIALVKRGGDISFVDKINTATQFTWSYYNSELGYYVTEYPVKAVIIYDEDPTSEELIYMSTDGAATTGIFISGKDGAAIVEAAQNGNVYLSGVEKQDRVTAWEDAGEMSEFSSWGAGPGLELKPEITAPGGNIWSAVMDQTYSAGSGAYTDYTGSYGMMSGTSMAAPHMSGIAALVKQYMAQTYGLSSAAAADLTQKMLVSTALPLTDGNDTYYSPRVQGAGLVDTNAAITSPAYISVDGGIGKLELKDDPKKTGSYDLRFTVHNLSDTELTYDAAVTLLRPATDTVTSDWGERTVMTDSDVTIKEVSLGTVTVPAYGEVTISQTVTLTAAEKTALDELFPNGTYIEGFVTLTSETLPQLGLPMLAFFGDWTKAPIYDGALWIDEVADGESFLDLESTWGTSVVGYFDGYAFYNLGQNLFEDTAGETQTAYLQENITISPTGIMKSVNDFSLHQLREARLVVVEVTDKETGEVYYRDYTTYQWKDYYNASVGVAVPSSQMYFTETSWDGTDLEGNVLPSGTQCVMTITAYGDGDYPTVYSDEVAYTVTDFEAVASGEKAPTFNGHAMDMTGDVIDFDVLVDTEAPKLVNSAVSFTEDEDGRIWVEGTFVDDGSIASVEVYPVVTRSYKEGYGDPSYAESDLDSLNPFYSEMIYDADVQEWTFRADVTEYVRQNYSYDGEQNYYNFTWTGDVYIFGGDYGGNDRAYGVEVDATRGLVLSTTSARLHVGGSFDLSVNNNTGSDAALVRSSSNPEVATIDEYGHIEAVGAGQTIITVTNGTDSAVCVVVVEEYPTVVEDFDLSIDSFSGLAPDGSIVVKVVNLKPADVVITENTWLVYENDEDWAGLVTVSQNTGDAMSGTISLNASLDDGEAASAGSGYLEVTLNGVTRTMNFDWNELYESSTQDGLISDAYYNEQTVYVNQGETASLIARYRQNHSFIPVELYTMEGYQSYSYSNPTTAATGVVLDGPTFATNGQQWTGKLVALPGYELPSEIKVCTRYDYGYESEMYLNSTYSGYTYDAATGEIVVNSAPTGATNTLVIRADGVATEGAEGGTVSGIEYVRPDATYGPFDWTLTSGTGTLTEVEGMTVNGETKNGAQYTPAEPGVSYVTATSKDGAYSVNFAVVCLPIQADTLTLDTNEKLMSVGTTAQLTATLSPDPTLEADEALVWTSFDESVATVDENGVVTAVGAGYAYIKVASAANTNVMNYCVVHVVDENVYTVTFMANGTVLDTQTVVEGEAATAPEAPAVEGKTFMEWDADFSCVMSDLVVNAVYRTNTYTVTFVADGYVVGTVTVSHGDVLTDADYPAVPEKEGYSGEWIKHTEPITGPVTIEAVYTELPPAVIASGWSGYTTWTLTDDGVLTVSPSGQTMENGQCNMRNYWKVDGALNLPWNDYAYQITSVVIEDGVNAVGQMAFYGLPNLQSVTLGADVAEVRNYAFKNCASLTSVTLNEGLETIGEGAFYGCAALTGIEIPSTVTTIGDWAFSHTGVTLN